MRLKVAGGGMVVALFTSAISAVAMTPKVSPVQHDTGDADSALYGIWPDDARPLSPADGDRNPVELGVVFSSTADGWITAIRYFKPEETALSSRATLWASDGSVLARVQFDAASTAPGWQTAQLDRPIAAIKGSSYTASYTAPSGRYADDQDTLGGGKKVSNRALTAERGVYSYGLAYPKYTWNDSNYYADVVFVEKNQTSGRTYSSSAAATSTSLSTLTSSSTMDSTTSASEVSESPTGPGSSAVSPTRGPKPTSTTSWDQSTSNSETSESDPPSSSPIATTFPPTTQPISSDLPVTASTPLTTSTSTLSTSTSASVSTTSTPVLNWDSKPGPSNTGVTDGTALKPSGSLTITQPNQVVSGLDINGSVLVEAPGVVIKNSKIHGSDSNGIYVRSGSMVISDSEIYGFENAIVGDDWSALRVNIHGTYGDGVKFGDNVLLQDSWIHDLTPASGSHSDGGQLQSGVVNLIIHHNFIDMANSPDANSALFLAPDEGPNSAGPVRVSDNWLNGGNYTVYCVDGNNGQFMVKNISFIGNRFGSVSQYGPIRLNVPIVQLGNLWDATGLALLLG